MANHAGELVAANAKIMASAPSELVKSLAELDELKDMGLLDEGVRRQNLSVVSGVIHRCPTVGELASARAKLYTADSGPPDLKMISWDDVAKRTTTDDCWVVIHNEVFCSVEA